ncbi:MAG: hypothetical protein WBQ94_04180 [Terracidiphilus sp.]
MTIARKPSAVKETKASRFIRGNGSPKRTVRPILINFEESLLARIDEAARASGLLRSAWITNACHERLRQVEQS